jgi:hypothetical protein
MWIKQHALRNEEKGDQGSGGGGGDAAAPDVQALIDKAVSEAVTGLQKKNGELLGKLKESGERLKSFDGIDPEAVRNILKRFSDDEEAALIAKGEIDTVLNKRTERMKAGYEKETAKEKAAREAAESRASKFTERVLESHIRAAASAAGLHSHAIDDALFRAKVVFTVNDDGEPIAANDNFGKDGKPLTLKEWMESMKDKAPHWWPAVNGGGANGSRAGGSRQMTHQAFNALPAKEQHKVAELIGAGAVTLLPD